MGPYKQVVNLIPIASAMHFTDPPTDTSRNLPNKKYQSQQENVSPKNILHDSQPASPESIRYSAEELEKQLLDSPTWKHRKEDMKFEPFSPSPYDSVPKKKKKKKGEMKNVSLFSQVRCNPEPYNDRDEGLNDFENYVLYK